MNFVSLFMLVFAILGAIDRILGNRFGLGKEFEKGFMLLGNMALSMIGMIVLAPAIADFLEPLFGFASEVLHLEPSIIPASLFANDMGGAPLSIAVAADASLGAFNAYVVSSMMGCTLSFTIPYALGVVEKERHKDVLLGFLCGIVTIPVGCFAAGLVTGIGIGALLWNLLPLVLFAILIACGLIFCPNVCVKAFSILGVGIKILITVGLVLGIVEYLTPIDIPLNLATLEEGGMVCLNASSVMAGAFPFMFILSKLFARPMRALGRRLNIGEDGALGFVSTLATSATTFPMMNSMNRKALVLNSAFAVSAAFTFAGHLAFTLAGDATYIFPMIFGKLIAGFAALFLSILIYRRVYRAET